MNQMIPVEGLWAEGYVFDKYSVSSEFLGEDVFGHPQFKTTYTEVGKLLHAMKYNGHFNTSETIADMCLSSLKTWLEGKTIDIILPAPPSSDRVMQPVYMIAEAIAERLHIPYSDEVLQKTNDAPAKNMPKDSKNLSGSIIELKPAKRKCSILLIDDFYSTGNTANECVSVLKSDPLVENVYYFAIAKTK